MEEIELTTAQKVPVKRIADFENLGFGLFMHYGLYSQIGRGEWGQYFEKVPADEYAKWIKTFNADDFNPREIVAYAKKAGMKYAVLTTRHHEGFSLYDTKGLSDFDVMHSPVKRDLVKEFVDACNEGGIIPFFYHTTLDWHDPRYNSDFPAYLEYLHKSVELLCTNYGKIGGLWFDGNWNNPERDWHADELYAIIRKHQPDAIIANNPGIGFAGTLYGDEEDVICFEQGTPSPVDQSKFKRYMAGEMSQTVNDHWAYWNKDVLYKGPAEIIRTMCGCRAAGANYLLNLTPDGTGKIATIQKGILEVLGQWTSVYGEPFYYGKPVPEIK
ncbi:MAG: alpha-L-fucosidase, partial [Oscillospiraceae bacterium]